MDKWRSTQRTDTENTVNKVNKSRSVSRNILSNKITKIEKPIEIDIFKDNKDISDLSLPVYDLAGITPDILHIPLKNKRRRNPDTSIIRK